MFIPLSFFASCGIIFLILCFLGREGKYDGHPDTWCE